MLPPIFENQIKLSEILHPQLTFNKNQKLLNKRNSFLKPTSELQKINLKKKNPKINQHSKFVKIPEKKIFRERSSSFKKIIKFETKSNFT